MVEDGVTVLFVGLVVGCFIGWWVGWDAGWESCKKAALEIIERYDRG